MSLCIPVDQSSFDCLSKFSPDALQQVFKQRGKENESGYVELPSDSLGTPLTAKLMCPVGGLRGMATAIHCSGIK